jgi:hypothetical protein
MKKFLGLKSKKSSPSIFDFLPKEVITTILYYSDDKTVASLLTTTKKLSKLSDNYIHNIWRQALQRELNNTKYKIKLYQHQGILDLTSGDRVTDNIYNYCVILVKDVVKLIHVDILGNKIDKHVYNVKLKLNKQNKYSWIINDKEIRYGLLYFDKGPEIFSVDDHYLKYKIVPKPEINSMVLVQYRQNYNQINYLEYVIKEMDDHDMVLSYVGNSIYPNLHAIRGVTHWVILERDFILIKIGGYGEKVLNPIISD